MLHKLSMAIVALVASASFASAATIDKQFEATSAVGNGADHSLWIQGGVGGGIGSDFNFDPAGIFTIYDDGTGTLIGTVKSQNDSSNGFYLSFNYDSDFSDNADTTPVFKSENGSVAVADLFFMDLEGGTLTGFGDVLGGLNLEVSRKPADGAMAVQIGSSNGVDEGPNNKNTNYGMAHWMMISASTSCDNNYCGNFNGRQGDINVDLEAVPLPATGLMLIGGLGAFAAVRRKRKS